jgi:hypothetical protein
MLQNTLSKRIRAEYLEMPGLRLTLAQAQRLCGADRAECLAALDALVDTKFLCRKPDGAYARLSDGPLPSSRVKTDFVFQSQPQTHAALPTV